MRYEALGPYRTAVVLVFLASGVWYLTWRFPTMAPDSPVFSAILYGAELYGFATALLHLMMTWRLTVREPPACPDGCTVDIFVPTYNEPVDLVRKTLLAALHVDYPHRTWLLDDGNREDMRQLAQRLGADYLARADNRHAKAGNLNHALARSDGQFIAIFDADHAPQRNFLRRTLGYFTDPQVAFVQTPQEFFNLDSYQHRWRGKKLWTEQALFFKVIQRGKDYYNAAFFCGSCAVVRRSALEKVGGFAVETVTEDLHTSIKLHKAGFRSVYHSEPLAFGIAPANVAPFLKQRVRWGQGAMQVLKLENPLFGRGLTLAQRLNYMASIITYFDGWQKGVFYVAPAIVLLAGIMPIRAGGWDFLLHFLPYFLLSIVVFEEVGRGYGGFFYIEQYNFARFAAFAWATLSLLAGKLRFKVTSKVRGCPATETRYLLPQLTVLALNTAAIPFALTATLVSKGLPPDVLAFNVVWALANCSLGALMFGFTRRTQTFLREEYRFPVPLPVVVRSDGRRICGTIDNISVNGCCIYARLEQAAGKGVRLEGEIYLPSGPLPFEAEVVSELHAKDKRREHYVKAVGCRFRWSAAAPRDALELFLYGTDLQWKLRDIREAARTPSQWLKERLCRGAGKGQARSQEHWAACEIVADDIPAGADGAQFGLVPLADGGRPGYVLSFRPLPGGHASVRALIHTRASQIGMLAMIDSVRVLENAAGPVYLYRLSHCLMPANLKNLLIMNQARREECEMPSLLQA